MKCYVITAIFTLCALSCIAQDIAKLKSVIPPSPTAASLGKYAEWPVNLFTGVAGISVPLATVRGRSISVPLTLNYHASGIRVSEIASWVGLGFSLDAGGVITRSIRGLPDDNGGYLLLRNIYTDPGDLSSTPVQNPILTDSIYRYRVARGDADSEPDSYNLNAMGRSYKLFFAGDGKIITQPASNLRITYRFEGGSTPTSADGELMHWTVITEDGTKLEFSEVETLVNGKFGPPENGSFQSVTAWYLSKITSPTNDIATFTYVEEEIEQAVSYSESDRIIVGTNGYVGIQKSSYRPRVKTKRLTTIETTLDSAIFVPKTRQDSEGNALSAIHLFSKIDGSCTKKILLKHKYSIATSSNEAFFTQAEAGYRLKLLNVTETSGDDQNAKTWAFDYNPKRLPSRNSYAQDHWGYFNDAFTNASLLPMVGPFGSNRVHGDRNPDEDGLKAEMLNKVIYPTGGYSEFVYEPNGYLANEKQYKDSTYYLSLEDDVYQFHIEEEKFINIQLSANFINYSDITTNLGVLTIRNDESNIVGQVRILRSNLTGNPAGTTVSAQVYIDEPGEYTAEVSIPNLEVFDDESLIAYVRYPHYMGTELAQLMTGGLRIKTISDYDGETKTVIKRSFQYEDAFVIQRVTEENYLSTTTTRTWDCATGVSSEDISYRNRSSNLQGTLFTSGIVGYGKVTTLYGVNGENGKSITWFTNEHDLNETDVAVIPFLPPVDRSWRRGQMVRKRDYHANGSLLAEERNSYQYVSPKTIKAFKSSFLFTLGSPCISFSNGLFQVLLTGYYDVLSEQVKQLSNTKIQFVHHPENIVDSIKTVQNFFYDTPANLQATRIETTDSKGNLLKTVSRTPFEKAYMVGISDWSAVIDSMVNRNIVGTVLQTETYNNETLLDRVTTKHALWSGSLILPSGVKIKTGVGSEETRLIIASYDEAGNLSEQQKVSDVLHSYIYDYSRSVPVAEVVNASTSHIAYTGFESDGAGHWTVTSSARVTSDSFTGSKSYSLSSGNLSMAGLSSSKSYIVSLWAKPGASINVNGNSVTSSLERNGWNLHSTTITGITTITVSGSGYIDDVRLHPVGAMMSTYTYGPYGVTSQTAPNVSTTYYEYDGLGRLTVVRDQNKQILKRMKYNYKAQ